MKSLKTWYGSLPSGVVRLFRLLPIFILLATCVVILVAIELEAAIDGSPFIPGILIVSLSLMGIDRMLSSGSPHSEERPDDRHR